MRVRLDPDLCQGHGTCCEEAPEVFELGADGTLRILLPDPPPELAEKVRLAVRYCPTRALAVDE